mmetsp:Transcript_20764/g.29607  ORF Transcript_20764/g.29607 Transcript_20764/m.29607 type:complete len:101 (-) Transcript_20764:16-318(-)
MVTHPFNYISGHSIYFPLVLCFGRVVTGISANMLDCFRAVHPLACIRVHVSEWTETTTHLSFPPDPRMNAKFSAGSNGACDPPISINPACDLDTVPHIRS